MPTSIAGGDNTRRTGVRGRRLPRRTIAILIVAYWGYIVNGIVNSEIGPALLGMVHSFHIGLATAGTIFTAQFAGFIVGAPGGGIIADRWGYRRVLFPATLLVAAGSAGTALVGTWTAVIVMTALTGLGFGMVDSVSNAVVAAEAPHEGGAALNLLHTFFGVGALLGPLIVAAFLSTAAGWHAIFLVTSGLAIVGTLLVIAVPIPLPAHLTVPQRQRSTGTGIAERADLLEGSPWRSSYLWLIAGLIFLFVGMEQLTGGWISAYFNSILRAHVNMAAQSAAIYWAAVTAGRLLASGIALRMPSERLLGGSVTLALAALVALALAGTIAPALLALSAAGLGFAPIYPTIMAITVRAYPRRFAILAGVLVAAGGLGGAVFPWLGGIVGQAWGLRATFWLDAGIAMTLLALFGVFVMTRWSPDTRP